MRRKNQKSEIMTEQENSEIREDAYSKAVRAGKRTYFFDVKATKNNDYFLTITESKRIFESDGKFSYEKHKIFLYREDFEKFFEGLDESLSFIKSKKTEDSILKKVEKEFSDINFEDLHSQEK